MVVLHNSVRDIQFISLVIKAKRLVLRHISRKTLYEQGTALNGTLRNMYDEANRTRLSRSTYFIILLHFSISMLCVQMVTFVCDGNTLAAVVKANAAASQNVVPTFQHKLK